MARIGFEKALGSLQDEALVLGSMVEKSIAKALEALERRDIEAARRVIADDNAIDKKRFALEDQCLEIIATQQPVASDLRIVMAIYTIAGELERIGDYAEGIAKISLSLSTEPLLKPLIDIPRMADRARDMLDRSLNALVTRDTSIAQQVRKDDDYVDDLYNQVYRELLLFMIQDPTTIKRATFLLWVAHDLERIADRATNIAERAIFLVTGSVQELNAGTKS